VIFFLNFLIFLKLGTLMLGIRYSLSLICVLIRWICWFTPNFHLISVKSKKGNKSSISLRISKLKLVLLHFRLNSLILLKLLIWVNQNLKFKFKLKLLLQLLSILHSHGMVSMLFTLLLMSLVERLWITLILLKFFQSSSST
jgi:hypothetical protein